MAQVAQSYGRSVSWSEVRSNAHLRREICRWIGHDTRLTEVCGGAFGSELCRNLGDGLIRRRFESAQSLRCRQRI